MRTECWSASLLICQNSYDDVDVVVSHLEEPEASLKQLKIDKQTISDPEKSLYIVNLKWLTDSNKLGKICDKKGKSFCPVRVVNGRISQVMEASPTSIKEASKSLEEFELPDYECQRATPLHHFNEELTVSPSPSKESLSKSHSPFWPKSEPWKCWKSMLSSKEPTRTT